MSYFSYKVHRVLAIPITVLPNKRVWTAYSQSVLTIDYRTDDVSLVSNKCLCCGRVVHIDE